MTSQHTVRAGNATDSAPKRPATQAHFHQQTPQITDQLGTRTWITRGAHFVVAISEVVPGSTLVRENNPDEYMLVLTPGTGARVQAGADFDESKGDALFILPPGKSTVTATTHGTIARLFSNRASDLCVHSANAAIYADGAPEVAPLESWPTPVDGFRLRHYRLEQYLEPKTFGRLFRSTNLMINAFEPTTVPRDTRSLSPHFHADFEQGSLSLSGTVCHHLRTPWTPDMSSWRADEHVEFKSPALLVIPANLIHTTRYTGGGPNWFFDIFSPPRIDFSEKRGWVRNADEYPMPNRKQRARL